MTAPFEISQNCSTAGVNFTHTITVDANNHWTQRTRVHNGNGRRYDAQVRTRLAGWSSSPVIKPVNDGPGVAKYQGPADGVVFDSDEKEIGVTRNNDTKIWYKEGQAPDHFYAWLQGGGAMTTLCSADKSHAFAGLASVKTVTKYW